MHAYPASAWALMLVPLLTTALIERRYLGGWDRMEIGPASVWLSGWSVLATVGGLALLWARGWPQATLYTACFVLNGMLSCDNLVVFMLLLQQSALAEKHHLKAISDGMLLALGMRALLTLAGAALLERFAWLLLVFAALLLLTGVHMLCVGEASPGKGAAVLDDDDDGGGGCGCGGGGGGGGGGGSGGGGGEDRGKDVDADSGGGGARGGSIGGGSGVGALAERLLGACVPVLLSNETGAHYLVRDRQGRWCATRMTLSVLAICVSDVLFAMDSVPVMLSLTTTPFLLISSQAASLLWLRPVYFVLAAIAHHFDSMQQVLAVVLILIACRTLLEVAGVQVPIQVFVGALASWRALACSVQLLRARLRRRAAAAALQAAAADLHVGS